MQRNSSTQQRKDGQLPESGKVAEGTVEANTPACKGGVNSNSANYGPVVLGDYLDKLFQRTLHVQNSPKGSYAHAIKDSSNSRRKWMIFLDANF